MWKGSRAVRRPVSGATARIWAGLLGVALFSVGCGIPQYIYLSPPILESATFDDLEVVFSHDPANDTDSFQGYELYYKFYDPQESPDVAFAADRALIESAVPANVITILANNGFLRVYTSPTESRPALPVPLADRGVEFQITLQFPKAVTDPAEAAATINTTVPQVPSLLRDQAFLIASGDETFAVLQMDPSDLDLSTADLAGYPEPTVPMGLAILSYGIDSSRFIPIYSEAVLLQSTLNLFYNQ